MRGAVVVGAAVMLAGFAALAVPPTFPPRTPPTSQPTSQPDAGEPTSPGLLIPKADLVARRIASAHGLSAWRGQKAIEADLTITFGDSNLLDAEMLYDPWSNRVRLESRDGVTMVFDGAQAWVSPPTDLPIPARFQLLTWTYFLAAPFKLRDPGTTRDDHQLRTVDGRLCESFRLTFDAGTGDSPDDWYVVYAEPGSTSRLLALAYIVTYGTSRADAEKEPHGIVYEGFESLNGVTLARRWTFREWSESRGFGDVIGRGELDNIRFVTPNDHAFSRPQDAVEDPAP